MISLTRAANSLVRQPAGFGSAGLPMPATTFYKSCRIYPVYAPQMPAFVLTAIVLNKLRGSCAAPDRGDEKLGRVAAAQV
jgi:hypothetical protein